MFLSENDRDAENISGFLQSSGLLSVFNAEFEHPTGMIVRHDDRHRPFGERFDELL